MDRRIFALFVSTAFVITVGEAQTRPHNFDLLDVHWSVVLDDPMYSLKGDVTNTLQPDPGATDITLDCGRDLNVSQVDVNGRRAEFKHDADLLHVYIHPGRAHDPVKIRIRYSGSPGAGLYYIPASHAYPAKVDVVYTQGEMVDNRFWLPTYDYPDDKATSEGFIDVPYDFTVISNGQLIGKKPHDRRVTFHYKMNHPHATYLISIVAGRYDTGGGEWAGIPIKYNVPSGLQDWGKATFAGTPDMVKFYSEITGYKYPYPKFDQSVVPDYMFGGMENITAVTNTIGALHPSSTDPLTDSRGLVLHELAHQWFGDTVTCSGWSDAWINEGWATFMPPFYFREKDGQEAFDLERYGIFQGALGADRFGPKRPVVWTGYRDALDMFDGHIYAGGAARMFMLMHHLGEAKFWKATQAYLQQRNFTSLNTQMFFDTWSENTGEDLHPFMQQWFFTPGTPTLSLTKDGHDLVISQKEPFFNLDCPIWIQNGGDWVRKTVSVSGAETRVPIDGDGLVLADPECWVLANIDYRMPLTDDQKIAMYNASPNAGGKARIMDSLLGSLPSDRTLSFAQTLTSHRMLERYISRLGENSRDYLLQLTSDSDRVLAEGAVQRLGQLKPTQAILNRLSDLVEHDPNDQIRQTALRSQLALTNQDSLADKAWAADGFRDGYRQIALGWWMSHKPELARRHAMEALNGGYPEPTRVTAIRMLGDLKDKPGEHIVYDALVKILSEHSFGARNTAIGALGAYGDNAAIPLLQPFTSESLVFFRMSAEGAINQLQNPGAPGGRRRRRG